MSLQGKLALVTGASRGIGAAIANRLAHDGATVIGTATSATGAKKISVALQAQGGNGMILDVNDLNSIDNLMQSIQDQYQAPTILVNNAAITQDNLLLRMKTEQWNDVITTNLTAVFHMTKACLRPMIKARWGRIINIASVVGLMGNPGQANYAAAKAGMIGFSKSIAREVATRNITVNVVAPGSVETDMTAVLTEDQQQLLKNATPMQRFAQPGEIAAAVGFLASTQASYITGQTLNVDGGMVMS